MNRITSDSTVVEEFAQAIKNEQKQIKIKRVASLMVLVVLVIGFSIFARGFFSLNNLIAIMNQLAIPLILAIGATFVIMIGGMDLSIEGLMGLTGTLTSLVVLNSSNALNLGFAGIVFILLIGMGVGLLTGLIQVKAKIPSFLLTYGMSSIATGITLLIYKGTPVGIKDMQFLSIAKYSFLGVPILMWISLAVLVIAYILQEYTAFGRYVYAIGSNEAVPRSTGINVDKIKILVFGFSGLCIGLAGVLGAARLSWGDLSIGTGNLFPAITAVVVGGTSLSGGKGGVINTLIGALIVTVLNNGLILSDVSPVVITGLQGAIILAAVAFSFDRGKGAEVVNK